jgi:hypothetical protein
MTGAGVLLLTCHRDFQCYLCGKKGKGKAFPLQAWTGPWGSWRLKLRISMQSAQEGGKVVSPTHRPSLPPGRIPGTHFC